MADLFNPVQTVLHKSYETFRRLLDVLIVDDIVNIVSKVKMFHPNNIDGISRALVLNSYVPTQDSSEEADGSCVGLHTINFSIVK